MKVLRQRFQAYFLAKMKNPTVTTDAQQQWLDLVKEALFSVKKEEEVKKTEPAKKVQLSVVRNA
jgi:hypothetical protein